MRLYFIDDIRRVFLRFEKYFQLFKTYVIDNSNIAIRNLLVVLGIFIVMSAIIGSIVFSFVRKGPPEVTVPKITGEDLVDGLIILQRKRLGAVIDPRFFSDHAKNTIVEQNPEAGSIVREGKNIRLIVSKGSIISIVEDYTGKTVTYVENRFQEIFSFQQKTLKIGNVAYVASSFPPGTIMGQYPPANTPIGDVESVDLIVSRGKEVQAFVLAAYVGKNINDVMELLALRGILVNIVAENVTNPIENGIIISQDPPEGAIAGRNDSVTFHVGYLPSEKEKEKLYARVLNFDMPADAADAAVKIVVKDKVGEREIYKAKNNGGDSLSIPFKSYSGTDVYIFIDDSLFETRKID
jgi:beta-lactam-binding protein with PASTA domain